MKTKSWMRKGWLVCLVLVIGLLSACSMNVERNADGSLNVASVMTEESVQAELQAALSDSMQDLTVDLHNGYLTATGEREQNTVSFRLDLGVADGGLTATISDLQINGRDGRDEVIERWNESIANRLERVASRRANSTLTGVSITENDVTFTWRVETPRSRN
jgi:hypothetical protein